MKHLFFDSLEKCEHRIALIDKALESTWQDGITETYCLPEKHPTKDIWALCVDESFLHLFTKNELEQAQEKTEDWQIKLEII